MNVPGATWRTNGLVVLVAALGLVVGAARPASAVEAAAGAGTGWEYIGPILGVCGLPSSGAAFQHDYFELDFESTYEAVAVSATADTTPGGIAASQAITVASYVGPVQMQITTSALVQAPQGAAPGGCANPLAIVPAPVPITEVYITGTTNSVDPTGHMITGEVECTGPVPGPGLPGDNTYTRIQSAVVFEFTVNCGITGNVIPGSVTDERMTHVVEGTQTPCQIPIVEPFVTGTNTYVDNPQCAAFGGDASSHLVAAFEAAGVP